METQKQKKCNMGEIKMSDDDFIIPEKKKINIVNRFKGIDQKIDKKKFILHGLIVPRNKKVPILPKKQGRKTK